MNEQERDAKIKLEIKRIRLMFKDISREDMKKADFLISRVAFMKVALEEMESVINAGGTIEDFTQDGIHYYERERPVSKMYNIMIKNYNSTIKQLFNIFPSPESGNKTKTDDLMKFIGKTR